MYRLGKVSQIFSLLVVKSQVFVCLLTEKAEALRGMSNDKVMGRGWISSIPSYWFMFFALSSYCIVFPGLVISTV